MARVCMALCMQSRAYNETFLSCSFDLLICLVTPVQMLFMRDCVLSELCLCVSEAK